VDGTRPLGFGEEIVIGAHSLTLQDTNTARSILPNSGDSNTNYRIIDRKTGTQFDPVPGVERIQSRREGATELFRIARLIATQSTVEGLTSSVLNCLCEQTNATMGAVLVTPSLDAAPAPSDLVLTASYGGADESKLSSFLSKVALEDKDAILAHDISDHEALAAQESLNQMEVESAICAPIRHADRVLGVIHLYSFSSSEPLSQLDLEDVLAVADQMGDQLHVIIDRSKLVEGIDRVKRVNSELRGQLQEETELVGHSNALKQLQATIKKVAPSDALVLIRGESGVGKELVARAFHFQSLRKEESFVCVNCAALTESLLESELFGHEKGAFTGASSRRAGKFEQADGGTLFLDEIGEMSAEIQAKFLRVLEGQAFERVGGGDPITVNVRVVTATNRDLEAAVRDGSFRRDLFFRLQVIEVNVPALREHSEDIPAIAQHFVNRFATQSHRKIKGFSTEGIKALQAHDWPGNVRELRNVVERAVILAEDELLGPKDVILTKLRLDDEQTRATPENDEESNGQEAEALETSVDPHIDLWGSFIQQKTTLDDIDRFYIEAVLEYTQWNKSQASRILQIERTTLDRRLKKYEIQRPDDEDDPETETEVSTE